LPRSNRLLVSAVTPSFLREPPALIVDLDALAVGPCHVAQRGDGAFGALPLDCRLVVHTDALRYRFAAAKVAAALRETTWSFVSEMMDKPIDFDFRIYSTMNADRYERMYAEFNETYGTPGQ